MITTKQNLECFPWILKPARKRRAVGPESEFQPGSRGRVLHNRLGIASVRELECKESEMLLATTLADY